MVEILLATYNSSCYIREQIDSIVAQTYKDWRLLVHDGGSSDDTVSIVREYAHKDCRVKFVGQERLTSVGNFAKLWKLSHKGYIMFSDHDDVWLPNKIEVQLKAMQNAESETPHTPILVFSDAKVVDGELNSLCRSSWAWQGLDPSRVELRHLLLQNVAAGNNMMVNGALREICQEIPSAALMHDYWLMLVACLVGRIVCVTDTLLLYRQHGKNVIGAGKMSIHYFVNRICKGGRKAREGVVNHVRQAHALRVHYGVLIRDQSQKELLEDFSRLYCYSWLKRRLIILKNGIFKCGLGRNLATLVYI